MSAITGSPSNTPHDYPIPPSEYSNKLNPITNIAQQQLQQLPILDSPPPPYSATYPVPLPEKAIGNMAHRVHRKHKHTQSKLSDRASVLRMGIKMTELIDKNLYEKLEKACKECPAALNHIDAQGNTLLKRAVLAGDNIESVHVLFRYKPKDRAKLASYVNEELVKNHTEKDLRPYIVELIHYGYLDAATLAITIRNNPASWENSLGEINTYVTIAQQNVLEELKVTCKVIALPKKRACTPPDYGTW